MNKWLPPFALGVVVGAAVGYLPHLVSDAPETKPSGYERSMQVDEGVKPAAPPPAPPAVVESAPASQPVVKKQTGPVTPRVRKAPAPTPEALVAKHWEDSIDVEWAEKAAFTLQKDFAKLETTGSLSVTSVDCRKTSCVAVLEWTRESDAEKSTQELLGGAYDLVCSKRLLFPPGKTSEGVRATFVFYECTR
jgi:hypothetical protein